MKQSTPWYKSKTVWVNVFALIVFVVQTISSPDSPIKFDATTNYLLGLLLGVINLALRLWSTATPIEGTNQSAVEERKQTARLRGKNYILLFLLVSASFLASAQSPFKPLPKPETKRAMGKMMAVNPITSAFRFTAPFAGYMYPQNQIVTGIGYGWQKLRYLDDEQKYYTDFSINAAVYAGGNTTPSLSDNNIISVGLAAGFINQLFMFGTVYNLPTDEKPKGSFGLVVNFSVPLNN